MHFLAVSRVSLLPPGLPKMFKISKLPARKLSAYQYTLPPRMFGVSCFWLETRIILKIVTLSSSSFTRNFDGFSWVWSFFWKKKLNGRFKITEFFKTANSQYFFLKISVIGQWASRINWCGSTYMVMRSKNAIFACFLPDVGMPENHIG